MVDLMESFDMGIMKPLISSLQTTAPEPPTPPRDLPWYQFSARAQERIDYEARQSEFQRKLQAYRDYRAYWVKCLTDEQLSEIFHVFKTSIADLKTSSSNAEKDIGLAWLLLSRTEKLVLAERASVTYDAALRLYQLLNYEFFIARETFVADFFTMMPAHGKRSQLRKWFDEVRDALSQKESKLTPVKQLTDYLTPQGDTHYEHFKAIASLPKELSERMLKLQSEVKRKLAGHLDGQTRHSLGKIPDEYIPFMVKSYIDIRDTRDQKKLDKVHASLVTQLTDLERFVERVDVVIPDQAIYELTIQEEFIKDKFKENTFG